MKIQNKTKYVTVDLLRKFLVSKQNIKWDIDNKLEGFPISKIHIY